MTFTPGPWRVGKTGCVVADVPVPEMGGSDDVDYYGGHLICESVTPANAKLISAAPDLLKAAKAILAHFAGAQHDDVPLPIGERRWDDLCHAVDKAEGR